MKKPNKERLKINRRIYDDRINQEEIEFSELAEFITHIIKEYGGDAKFVNDYDCNYIEYTEPETDMEYNDRMEKEEKAYNKAMEKKRIQFEKLKEELEEE